MKTFLKIFGVLIALVIIAIITVPYIFKDDIVKIVKEEANNAVNAKIDFGDFDLSLIKSFPDFYFSIHDISVEGIDDFEGVKLAEVKELDLVVDLMSVINGESINVKQITIRQPYIETKVLADGKANYDIAKESEEVEEETEVESEEASTFKMDLQKIEITDGRFIYDDATFPMLMDIQKLNLLISGDMTADITNLDAQGSVETFDLNYDGMQMMNQVAVLLDATIGMDLEQFKFTFTESEVIANNLPLGIDGWLAMPEESIDMDLTFLAKETSFKNILSMIPAEFAKDLEGVKTEGTLALQGYAKGSYLDSVYPAFGIDLQIANGMFQYPDLPKSVSDVQVKASVESKTGDLDHTIVDVSQFHLLLADNPFDFNFYLATPISDPFIRAGMKGKLILDNIKDVVPLEESDELAGTFDADFSLEGNLSTIENEQYEDFKARGTLVAEKVHYASDSLDYPIDLKYAAMEFTPKYLELSRMEMLLGKSDLNVNGRLENFIGYALKDNQTLVGELNVNSNLLDINQLAGIDPEQTEEESESEEETTDEEPMEALLLPKFIDFTATADIKKLIFDNINMSEIKGAIVLKEEKLSMTNTGLSMLGGRMSMDGYYETTDSLKPTYDFDMDIKDFDVQQTVTTFNSVDKLVPIAKSSKGSYSVKMQILGALTETMDPVYESMFGEGKLETHGIVIKDYKPFKKIGDVLKYDKLNPLALNDLFLDFQITEGKVFVAPFTNKIGDTKVTIAGSNSFDQTIDYTFSFEIPRDEFGSAANKAVDGLLSQASAKGIDVDVADVINVDVRLVGPATDPEVKTDFKKTASSATDALKEKAKEEFNKKKEELEQKAKEELEKKKAEAEQKAKEELEKAKKEAEEELERQKEEAKKKAEEEAKKKLKGLFGK